MRSDQAGIISHAVSDALTDAQLAQEVAVCAETRDQHTSVTVTQCDSAWSSWCPPQSPSGQLAATGCTRDLITSSTNSAHGKARLNCLVFPVRRAAVQLSDAKSTLD